MDKNILDNYGLANGLKNFFIPNHNVVIDEKPEIIRVTVQQSTNTPGVKTPIINVDITKRYKLTLTGYTESETCAFVTISNNCDFKNIATPVYLKTINREISIEFTPTHQNIQIFVVIYQPKSGQLFYISDIKLQETTKNEKIDRFVIEKDLVKQEPIPEKQQSPVVKQTNNLNNLLKSFHKFNDEKTLNNTQEVKTEECDLESSSDDEPMCLMGHYYNSGLTSFSMGSFATPMPHYHQAPVVKKPKPEKCDIQKENLNLGKKVVDKQKILVDKLIDFLKDWKVLIEESILLKNQEIDKKSVEKLKNKLIGYIKEINYITLAKVDDINIFTPFNNHFESCPLLIECNKHQIDDDDYNIYIKKYKLDVNSINLNNVFNLLFIETDSWIENHQKALSQIIKANNILCNYKNDILQDQQKIQNRLLVI